jgi:hypothetical protein
MAFKAMTSRQIGENVKTLPKLKSHSDGGGPKEFKYYVQESYNQFYDKDAKNPKFIADLNKATKVLNPSGDVSVKLPDQQLILKIAQMRYTVYRRSADEKLIEGAVQAQAKADKKAQAKADKKAEKKT